jgi:hypothetical protein
MLGAQLLDTLTTTPLMHGSRIAHNVQKIKNSFSFKKNLTIFVPLLMVE